MTEFNESIERPGTSGQAEDSEQGVRLRIIEVLGLYRPGQRRGDPHGPRGRQPALPRAPAPARALAARGPQARLVSLRIDEMFAALPARLQAPAELLHYELVRLEGHALSEDARAGLAARWPGWRWWLDAADDDCGPLAMLRDRRDILAG